MYRNYIPLLAWTISTSAFAGDWLHWRGPGQDGHAHETTLPSDFRPDSPELAWTWEVPGRSTPAVHGNVVYTWGYEGTGNDLREVLTKRELLTGEERWSVGFRDYISDIIYDRYSIGAPAVDPATGHVFVQTANGRLATVTPDGQILWEVDMMSQLGRLTFPNGRTGMPVIAGDLVIVHGITANWGSNGPARDRFYAFDKADGTLVWTSTPGIGPRDSSWSTPVLADVGGRRVLYAGTGCGNIVAIDARTGEALWRARMSEGGVNVTVALHDNLLYASHAKENLDSSRIGRMVAWDLNAPLDTTQPGTPLRTTEAWRADLAAFSTSPVVAPAFGVVLQTTMTGELVALDLATGAERWRLKLGPDQLHASPTLNNHHLYVPLRDGSFHVVNLTSSGAEVVSSTQLEGQALAAPAIAHGHVLVQTTAKLYVFRAPDAPVPSVPKLLAAQAPSPGDPVSLRVTPDEFVLTPGEAIDLTATLLDANGHEVRDVPIETVEHWIPPTAKVKTTAEAYWNNGKLVASHDAGPTAGAFQITAAGMTDTIRGRTVAGGRMFWEDFQGARLDQGDQTWTWPPLAWIGARFKWQITTREGEAVLAKTLDRMLFQRSTVFFGHPYDSGYTLAADMLTDGNRRSRSDMGLVNQRYLFALKGNQRVLEVSSNYERLTHQVPFPVEPGVWYRMETQVVLQPDGSGTVRARVWPRDESKPEAWTIEFIDPQAHPVGAAGLYGFSPQNLHAVYLDNIAMQKTEAP